MGAWEKWKRYAERLAGRWLRRRRKRFDPHEWPDKLNLGCGWDHRDGYLNVDLYEFHNPDLAADITTLAMLPRAYYREIVAQDVLEHIGRTQTADTLKVWAALLAPGGRLILRVPSLLDLAQLFDGDAVEQHETLMQCLFGTQAYAGDYHLTSFTQPLLRHYLANAGLTMRRCDLRDGWLFDVEATKGQPVSQFEPLRAGRS